MSTDRPSMVLDARTPPARPGALPAGVSVRVVTADDPGLPSVLAVTRIAYGDPGSVRALARTLTEDGTVADIAGEIRHGRRVVAGAFGADGQALAGAHCTVDGEVHTVGTLPAAQGGGLGYEVTRAVLGEARHRGQRHFHLTAENPASARLYARLGFRAVPEEGEAR
ncbi:GNAT family N-acetyltransferase [Streptomyces sp. NPDC051940]|uniref:GNAT family N-acetyltransferase n=1 Tax=Streptomyces sp. NPDC051940 TaxID=3155675 RepID=UPI003417A9ED